MTKEEIQNLADQIFAGVDETASTTDRLIRTALENVILAVDPESATMAYNGLINDPEAWANIFQTAAAGNDIRTVRGWVIKRGALTSEEFRANSSKTVYRFDVWGFYGFYAVSADDNSDNKFQTIIDKICRVIRDPQMQKLGLADCLVDSQGHLQFDRITGLGAGKKMLHFAAGKIDVHLCAGKY